MSFGQKAACRKGVLTQTYGVKGILVSTLCLSLAACGSKNSAADALQAERDRLEAERSALTAEKERLAEAEELNRRHAAADAELKRLAIERAKELEAENRKLSEEQAKLEEERTKEATASTNGPSTDLPGAMEPKRLVELDPATVRAAEERRRLIDLNAQAEADRLTQQRLAAEAKVREAAARRAEAEAATLRTVALFYDPLASQGSWFDSDRYGYVWQPQRATIDREWRPYTDGRWQWTEHGWTWQSLEPYGWAVYHYGRWFRHPESGWLWVPGHEWAPAWVSWRVKGSEYAGWAPLPPSTKEPGSYGPNVDRDLDIPPSSYVFLQLRDFAEPTYVQRFVERSRRMEMLRGSRNITRLAPRASAAGSINSAAGPDPVMISSVIREASGNPDAQPVPQLNLVFIDKITTGDANDIAESGAMVLYAPKLQKGATSAKPAKVQGTVRVPAREHGWSESTAEHEAEWRSMVEQEAIAAARPPAASPARNSAFGVIQTSQQAKPATPQRRAPVIVPPTRQSPLNPASLQPANRL